MRRPDEKSTTHPSPGPAGDKPNAFASALFEELREREPEPAVPEAGNAGPWHVLKLHGPREPLFACHGAGEAGPRLTFDAPDLANLAAAALAVSERPPRFRWHRSEDGRLHLLHDGQRVATAEVAGEDLPLDLTRLAELRAQPLPLAQLLASVPQEVLRRAGVLVMEILREGR
jgi:hypothetical protein